MQQMPGRDVYLDGLLVPVKIDKRAGSSEMPRNLVRCPARHPARQKPLDVRAGMDEATFARPLRGVHPA